MPAPILAPGLRKPGPRGKPAARQSGSGGFGGGRIAGLPAPVVLGGVVLAVVVGLYFKHKASTAAAATTAAPALADTGTSSGGASGGSGADSSAGLADAIYGLTGILAGGGGTFQVSDSGAPAPVTTAPSPATPTSPFDPVAPIDPALVPTSLTGRGASATSTTTPIDPALVPSSITGHSAPTTTAPQQVPQPPHSSATVVMPAQSAAVVSHREAVARNKATAASSGTHTSGL